MGRRLRDSLKTEMMQIVAAWKASGGAWPAPVSVIVDFALVNGLYNVPSRVRKMCGDDLADAMREEFISDTQGRPVRKLHAARFSDVGEDGKKIQRTLWADIDNAPCEFMEVAFQQRRRQIVGDCRQLNNDVEYYNRVRKPGEKSIQMWFDFRDDVQEGDLPDEYIDVPVR